MMINKKQRILASRPPKTYDLRLQISRSPNQLRNVHGPPHGSQNRERNDNLFQHDRIMEDAHRVRTEKKNIRDNGDASVPLRARIICDIKRPTVETPKQIHSPNTNHGTKSPRKPIQTPSKSRARAEKIIVIEHTESKIRNATQDRTHYGKMRAILIRNMILLQNSR